MPKIEVKLKQHTPVLQLDTQIGAGIRVTELKPALDRFLWKKYQQSHGELLRNCKLKDEQTALNYRVKIVGNERRYNCEADDLKKTGYYSFGMGGVEKQKPMFSNNEICVTLLTASAKLLNLIRECIAEFFFFTNFGYRKSKGFGSYTVTSIDGTSQNVSDLLSTIKASQTGTKMYEITQNNINGYRDNSQHILVLQSVATVASIMKSGKNFDKKYDRSILMKEYAYSCQNASGTSKPSYSNEKRKMKEDIPVIRAISAYYDVNSQYGIQKTSLPSNPRPTLYRFSRVMLGFAEQYTFRRKGMSSRNIYVYDAKNPQNGGFRMQSPMLFKPVFMDDKWRVFVLLGDLPKEIYKREFYFSTYKFNENQNKLSISERMQILNDKLKYHYAIKLAAPSEGEFSLQDFMAYVAAYKNPKRGTSLDGRPLDLRGYYPLIKEV